MADYSGIERIGEDELGIDYRAERVADERVVLLTVYREVVEDPAARRRLRADLLACAEPAGRAGLLAALDAGFTTRSHPYLVTDLPAGGTLAALLAAEGPLPVARVVRIAGGLAAALEAAHRDGVLHLDVRPGNVWLDGDDRVLLRGAGVLRALRVAGATAVPPAALVHAPPELLGWQTPSGATDVYGLGSTLYALLGGEPAYAAAARLGQESLYRRALRGDPPRLDRSDLPAGFADLVYRMMAADPADRPAVDEVRRAAGRAAPSAEVVLLEPAPVPPEPEPEFEPAAAGREWRGWRYAGAAAVLAVALVALAAGLVWGAVTGRRTGHASARPRLTERPLAVLPQPLQDEYRATAVTAAAGGGGVLVSWKAPRRTDSVALFLVVAQLNSQDVAQQVVGPGGRSVAFAGLATGQDYCFRVSTVVQRNTRDGAVTMTAPVCAVAPQP